MSEALDESSARAPHAPPVSHPPSVPNANERDLALRRELAGALATELARHLPGFEILDRDLEVPTAEAGASVRADWVAIDATRRIVLVLLVDGRADVAVLAALECTAALRASRALIAEHLGARRLAADGRALVVLVSEAFSARALRRLSVLSPLDLRLFATREISSASGSRMALAAVDPAHPGAVPADIDRADFLAHVPAARRPLAELCLARIDRVDGELEACAALDAIGWRHRGRALCSLACVGGELEGAVGTEAVVPIRDGEDVEEFVERVLAAHVRRLDAEPDPADLLPPPSEPDDAGGLPLAPGVLLTPEEIAAFRD
jgi:hypothetical protein